MAKYIQVTAIKKKMHELGKRVPPSYLNWLDIKVGAMMAAHAKAMGHHKTMSIEDLEAAGQFNAMLPKRKLTR